jgi:hypothetical protein
LLKFREKIQGIPKGALGEISLCLSLWNNYDRLVFTKGEEFGFGKRRRSSHQGAIEILESLGFN